MWLLVVSFCHMLKIPADLILLKGGVLVRWSTCLLYILFFSFSHSEVDILLQTQCQSLNFDGVATRGGWRPYILPVLILTTMKVN